MHELFLFGSMAFWGLVAVELVLLFIFTEFENGKMAIASVVAFLFALQWMSDVNIIAHLWANPLHILFIAAAYLLLGVGWMTFQWVRYIRARIKIHDEHLEEFLERKGITGTKVVPQEYRSAWKDRVEVIYSNNGYKDKITDVPRIKDNKARVIRWMSLWPFSLLLFLFKDMVKEIFLSIYFRIAKYLQRIADNMWRSDISDNTKIDE